MMKIENGVEKKIWEKEGDTGIHGRQKPVHTWYIKKIVAQKEMEWTKQKKEQTREQKKKNEHDEKWVKHLKAEIVWKD